MRPALIGIAAVLGLTLAAAPASAAVLGQCAPVISVETITEPWEDYSRSFANGAIRVFESYLDPNLAAGAAIGVLHPDAEGFRTCTAIFAGPGPTFYAEAQVSQATAVYDAWIGLIVSIPVRFPDDRPGQTVEFSVNQQTGRVTLR